MGKNLRFPKNAEGDFYTTGCRHDSGSWAGDCLACCLPEAEAPLLMAPQTDENSNTYFLRQPENEEEIEQAISVTQVCCVGAVRYSGKEKSILRRIHSDQADYKISLLGQVVPNE